MSAVIANLKSGIKRLFGKNGLLVLLLILCISIYFVSNGCDDYKIIVEHSKEFQDIEAAKYKKLQNYLQVSIQGIGVFFLPSKLLIISINSTLLSDMSARINTVITMDIFNSLKGISLFQPKSPVSLDFSGIVLLFLTLLALYIGFESLRHTEFSKSQSSTCAAFKYYSSSIVIRVAFLSFAVILVYAGMSVVFVILDIELSKTEILGLLSHAGAALLMVISFFFLGVITGAVFRSVWKALSISIVLWVLFIFVLPGMIQSIVKKEADQIISNFQTEYEQLKIVSNFEKRVEEKNGKFNSSNLEVEREIAEDFWLNDYKKIEALEEKLKNEIAEVVNLYSRLSILTPIGFFNLTSNEISSRAYENYLMFYGYLQKLKRNLVRFWIDQVYYGDPSVVIPFIKGDENVYKGHPVVPENYLEGALQGIGINIILFVIGFFCFIRVQYKITKKDISRCQDFFVEVDDGDLRVWFTEGESLRNLLYNLLTGKYKQIKQKGFTGEVLVNDSNIAATKCKENFLYICNQKYIPANTKVRNYITYHAETANLPKTEIDEILNSRKIKPIAGKFFEKLKNHEKFETQLALTRLKKKQVYLIDDIATGLPLDFSVKLKERMDELTKEGSIVFYLTTQVLPGIPPVKMGKGYLEGSTWLYMVKELSAKSGLKKKNDKEK